MTGATKTYSTDKSKYQQTSVTKRLEAIFLANVGLVLTSEQLRAAARDPKTGGERENWHQRLSELRVNHGYTILTNRDRPWLKPGEYLLETSDKRELAAKRVAPTPTTWKAVQERAGHACEWQEDGQRCGLKNGAIDPIGGGTVRLTADHTTPHSINPNSDPDDPKQWQALCGRHQVMKKNYWDGQSGKINVVGILQAVNTAQKREAQIFLNQYFDQHKP